MKSFDEFWSSLTEDDFVKFSHKAQESMNNIECENPTHQLGSTIMVGNIMMMKQILARYHKWLSEQL